MEIFCTLTNVLQEMNFKLWLQNYTQNSKEDNIILNAITQLKSGKSSGPDHMLNDCFIYGKNEMINCLYAMFNSVKFRIFSR